MPRLPTPGGDNNQWGDILNEFLEVEHNEDGSLKTDGSLASKANTSHTHAQADITNLTTDLSTITSALGTKFGNNQDLVPATDDTYSVGSSQYRWKKMHTTQFDMIHKTGDGTHTVTNEQGSIVAGKLHATSGHTASMQALRFGSLAGGYVSTVPGDTYYYSGGDAAITAGTPGNTGSYPNTGGFAWGIARAGAYPGRNSTISATGPGSFATGVATEKPVIASGIASFAQGYGATASGLASFAQGRRVVASNLCSFAQGRNATASQASSFAQGQNVTASGFGSFAQGLQTTASGSTSFAQGYYATASGHHSFAQGYATYEASLEASGNNSFAQGGAYYQTIDAQGIGSFAQGHASNADIIAEQRNSVQFGEGTNDLADSLKVGDAGLRLKGKTGAPASPVNGDQWVANGYVYIRSNGVSVKIGA